MKYFIVILFSIITLIIISCEHLSNSKINNIELDKYYNRTIIDSIFDYKLKCIYNYITHEDTVNSCCNILENINFFELLTSIKSESPISTFGKMDPTLSDIAKWKNWYNHNKKSIYIDSINHIIIGDTIIKY